MALPYFAPSTGCTPPGVRHRWRGPQWEVRSRSHAGNLDRAAGSSCGHRRASVVASCGAGPEVRAAETPSPCVSTRFTWGPAPTTELATRQVVRTTPAAGLLRRPVDGPGDNLRTAPKYLLKTLGISCGQSPVENEEVAPDLRRPRPQPVQKNYFGACRRTRGFTRPSSVGHPRFRPSRSRNSRHRGRRRLSSRPSGHGRSPARIPRPAPVARTAPLEP